MNWKVLGISVAAAASLGWDLIKRVSVRHNQGVARGKRILILGGGFGGAEAGRELERLLPGEDNGEVILVNETEYLLFTPMLTEAVGGDLEPQHIIVPLKSYAKRARLIVGQVAEIDLENRSARIEGANGQTLSADHLVIALGASPNFHHAPGVQASAIEMKTLEDAWRVKQGALALVKSASRERDPAERAAMLTFVVAGGGYTGVETIASLNDMVRETVTESEGLQATDVRMILAEPAARLMSEVTDDLASYTQRELERSGIEVKLKTGVKSAEGDSIEFTDGQKLRARTFIWTAGVEANKLVGELDAPKGKSKALKVTGELALKERQGVWALGDCAEIPRPDGKGHYAATAQNATREGKLVARNIVRSLRGEKQKPFRYVPIGELALVGRRRGVARIYNLNFSGFIAYMMWRFVYVAKLPSMGQRMRVVSDYLLDGLFGPASRYQYAVTPPMPAKIESSSGKNAASA